jgi:hypothetical protein
MELFNDTECTVHGDAQLRATWLKATCLKRDLNVTNKTNKLPSFSRQIKLYNNICIFL